MTASETFYAVSDVAFIIGSLGMAALVLAGGRQAVNVLLAIFFALWGITSNFLRFLTPGTWEASVGPWANALTNGFALAILPVYLAFLGVALPTSFARPFGRPPVRAMLLAVAAASIAASLLFRDDFLGGVGIVGWSGLRPGVRLGVLCLLAAAIAGLVCALDALRRTAPGTAARARIRAYTVAFVLFDLGQFAFFAAGSVDALEGAAEDVILALANFASVAGLALLARALLRFQLFDFDLKLKRGLSRGTTGAAFVAAFFVVSELVQAFASAALGVVAGTLAAGLLLFALAPLQRAADRVADTAMPRVHDTAEYRLVRKREVYLAALESAMEDGQITDKERGVLATLASQLGLDPREAYDLEREARAPVAAQA